MKYLLAFALVLSQWPTALAAGARLKAGDPIPAIVLPDHQNRLVPVNQLLSKGPVILIFYRGNWCPFCNAHLHELQQELPNFKKLGATLVAISPQVPDQSLETIKKNELQFYVLSDLHNTVARKFGIVFKPRGAAAKDYEGWLDSFNGDKSLELPHPATYVIKQDGRIAFADVHENYSTRTRPEQILEVLRSTKASGH